MTAWLDTVAEFGRRAWHAGVDWVLVGSAASALQGVPVEPADVDVLVRRVSDVATIAGHLYDLARPTASARTTQGFFSSTVEPLLAEDSDGVAWTFGRWMVGGERLEVFHLTAADVGLVETWGRRVWEVRRDVTALGVTAPCVPLEVQVATALADGNERRRTALTATLAGRKVDAQLLSEALVARGYRPATIEAYPDVWGLLPEGMRPRARRAPEPGAAQAQ